eukprot:608270-Lingulodinium_polyedra.AAC.1
MKPWAAWKTAVMPRGNAAGTASPTLQNSELTQRACREQIRAAEVPTGTSHATGPQIELPENHS